LRNIAIPNTIKITPINLPSLFSSTLLATTDPDTAPIIAPKPAINTATPPVNGMPNKNC